MAADGTSKFRPNAEAIGAFWRSLYGDDAPGWLAIWTREDKATHWFRADALDDAAQYAAKLAEVDDCYFGVGLQRESRGRGSRGTASGVIALGGVWLDLDVKGPAHAQQSLPETIEEALDFLNSLPHRPTLIVESGHGLQAWWLFQSLWNIEGEDEHARAEKVVAGWQRLVSEAATARGWRIDNTSDLARVLRAPGTLNHKKARGAAGAEPLLVTLTASVDGARYSPSDLERYAKAERERNPSRHDEAHIGVPIIPADAAVIARECTWFQHCRDDAISLPEPEWLAMLSIAGRCENGKELAHDWSRPHPTYSPADTDKKLRAALENAGPWTCEAIGERAGGEEFCGKCVHRGRVKSPISLGMTALPRVLDQYIYVVGIKRFIDPSNLQQLDKEQLDDAWAHEWRRKGSLAKAALASSTLAKVDNLTFAPGASRFVIEEGERRLNLWRSPDLPLAEGDVSPFLEHMEYLIPDEEVREQVLDYLAFLVQQPGEKIHYALTLTGLPGIGKTFLSKAMEKLLGFDNVKAVGTDELQSPFTGWLKNTQLVVIEEMMALGRRELMNKLKPIITQSHIRINEKFVSQYRIPNRANFLIFSNHEDAVLVEDGDRRYFIYASPVEPRDEAYYKGLFNWLEEHAGALLDFFRRRDLAKFNPKAHAPMTEAKREVIKASRPPLEAYLVQAWEDEAWPLSCDLVVVNHLVDALATRFKATVSQVTAILKKLGAERLGQKRMVDNEKPAVWAIRRPEIWSQVSEKEIAEKYLRPVINRDGDQAMIKIKVAGRF